MLKREPAATRTGQPDDTRHARIVLNISMSGAIGSVAIRIFGYQTPAEWAAQLAGTQRAA